MEKTKEASVGKSAFQFAIGTFFSRISGMLREVAMAYTLGTSVAAAAFLVAFRFAYLLRRILGEGALVNGFVPHYESIRATSEKEAAFFFRDLLVTLGCTLLLLISLTEIGLGASLYWNLVSNENASIIKLIMLMLPGLFFICFFALQSGFLQCQGQFLLTGVAPAAFNVAWIGTLLLYRHAPASTITTHLSLALGLAFFVQWLLLWPQTSKHLKGCLVLRDWMRATLFSPAIRKMLKGIALSIVSVSAMQINSFIDMLFARYADLQGPAYLSYAIRLQQLPLALFGIAIASAVFPSLARAVQSQDEEKTHELLRFGILRSSTLMIPCTLGIFILGGAAVNLLFGHGNFTHLSTIGTTHCLWGYGIGLLPATYVLLFSQAFFVRKDFLTPTLISLATMLFSTLCNICLVMLIKAGPVSIAITTSLAAIFQALILMIFHHRRYGSIAFNKKKRMEIGKLLLSSCLAAGLTLYLFPSLSLFEEFPRAFSLQFLHFIFPASLFGLTFLAFCWIMRVEDIRALLKIPRQATD